MPTFTFEEATEPTKFSFEEASEPVKFSFEEAVASHPDSFRAATGDEPDRLGFDLSKPRFTSSLAPVQEGELIDRTTRPSLLDLSTAEQSAAAAVPDSRNVFDVNPMQVAGDISRAAVTDAIDPLVGNTENSGNLLALSQRKDWNAPLPVDVGLAELSRSHPNLAAAGQTGQALASMLPMTALGAAPAWANRIIAAGFSLDMIHSAPELFKDFAEEIYKPKDEQDSDKLAKLKSGLLQTLVFAPAAGMGSVHPSVKQAAAIKVAKLLERSELGATELRQPSPLRETGERSSFGKPEVGPEGALQSADIPAINRAREAQGASESHNLGEEGAIPSPATTMPHERIVAVAVKHPETGKITSAPGKIHVELFRELGINPANLKAAQIEEVSGFLTDRGRFVNRDEANKIGQKQGLVEPRQDLMGEDVARRQKKVAGTPKSAAEPISPKVKKPRVATIQQEFGKLAIDFAAKTGMPFEDIVLIHRNDVEPAARAPHNKAVQRLRRQVFRELGLDNLDPLNPDHIKIALARLKERMVEVDEKVNASADPEGGVELETDNPLTPEDWPVPDSDFPTAGEAVKEPWQMKRWDFAKAAEPNKIPPLFEPLDALAKRSNRSPYNPDVITDAAVAELKAAGFVSGTKNFKLTEAGRNQIDDWRRDVRENDIQSSGASDEHFEHVLKAVQEGKPVPADVLADYPENFPPAKQAAPLPKLREKENQGDLMANQTEDFALVPERGIDFERKAREKAAAEQRAAEAKAKAEREQQGFDLGQTKDKSDPFERARGGEDSAFEDLDAQFREINPEPDELARRPDRNTIHTPEAFRSMFEKAFAARDFDSILTAIKATSDVSIWKPFMKEQFAKQAAGDATAAKKVDWLRAVFNGTIPADAIPKAAPKPPPAGATPPPKPGPAPKPGAPPPPPPKPPGPTPTRIQVEPIPGGGAKSPFQIIEDFSTAIEKSIRVLKMKRNQLGVYRPGSTTTATRFAGDLDTVAHELAGHWIDDKYGVGKAWVKPRTRSPYDAELAKFWIHGSVTPRSTLAYRRAEGIAEYVRAYVMNPAKAKLEAPTFSKYFEKSLPPEALKAINNFGEDVRRWAGEDPLRRAGLNIRMDPPTLRERLWRGIQGRGFGFEVSPMDTLRLWFDDSYHYAMKANKAIQEMRGGKVLPKDDFELMTRLLATHDSRMSDQFERGLVSLNPKQVPGADGKLSVERLIDPVTKQPMSMKWLLGAFDTKNYDALSQNMRDASAFMVAQRTIEKAKQFGRKDNISGIGAGMMDDVQAAKEVIARVAADPKLEASLKEAARRYRLWADKNIDMLVDAGRLTPEAAKEIKADNRQYVDMHRLSLDFEVANREQRGGFGGIGTARDQIKKFKGSSLELDNVYSNLLEQTDSIQREAHRNVVMNTFNDGLRNVRSLHGANLMELDQIGRKVTARDANTIRVFKDGREEHWQYDPDVYESLKGLGELGVHKFIDIAAAPSTFARYMITHAPQFIVRNVLRDTAERTVNSRNASRPWDILEGYTEADLSRYEVFGGGQFGNYIKDRQTWDRELKRTMKEMSTDPRTIFLDPLKMKRGWESLSEKSEKLGRIAEFRRAFEKGKKELGYDDENAALYAAGQARGLLDFAKAGVVMRAINRLVPFSNARMRGLARNFSGIKENPGAYGMRWGVTVLLPTLAVMAWNRRDPETWEEYLQLPAYRRDFFWNIKVGPHWIAVPKPHLLGVLSGGVERAIIRASGDKRAMEGYWGSAKSNMPIGDPAEAMGPLKSIEEVWFNRDTFRDRDIIPMWERDLKLELRKGKEHASGAGKGIAGALNVTGLTIDPRQVDHILGSYGGAGQIAMSGTRKNESLGTTALKTTGLVGDMGASSRDLQWVMDWAKGNGKLNSSEIKYLSTLRAAVFEEKDAARRDAKAKELRKQATIVRNRHDK